MLDLYVLHQVVIPGLLLILTNIASEVLKRWMKSNRDYMYISTSIVLCVIVIYFNPGLHAILSVLLLPIFISVYFVQKKKIIVAGILSVAAQLVMYFTNPDRGQPNSDTIFDLLAFLMMTIGEVFIALSIMNRNIEMLDELREKSRVEQDLLIQNIVMEKDSKTDALTGLNNRRSLNAYLSVVMQVCTTTHTPLHLAVIDIDDFKLVNDQYGHPVGDVILHRIAKIIEHNVTPEDFLARYGGEEFALVISESSFDEAYELMEHIRASIASVYHSELENKPLTVSIGLCSLQSDEDQALFFSRADDCLYRAKRLGKNLIVTPTPTTQSLTYL